MRQRFFSMSPSHDPVLLIQNIAKAYGPVQALRDVSFAVPQGSVFGILGPNGSGKTTLLGIVLGVLHAQRGSYSWFGNSAPEEARKQIGSLLETPNFFHYMSGWDNLEVAARIKGRTLEDRERVLRIAGLWERRAHKFSTYSLGMKQRLAIASALLGAPRVLVLDEPTNGLDPAGIAEVRSLIRALREEGTTVVMASHLLDEVEKVCTHVAVLQRGALLATGGVDEVMRSEDELEVGAEGVENLETILLAFSGVQGLRRRDGLLLARLREGVTAADVNRYCASQGIPLSHLVLKKQSLESRFIQLTAGQAG